MRSREDGAEWRTTRLLLIWEVGIQEKRHTQVKDEEIPLSMSVTEMEITNMSPRTSTALILPRHRHQRSEALPQSVTTAAKRRNPGVGQADPAFALTPTIHPTRQAIGTGVLEGKSKEFEPSLLRRPHQLQLSIQ